MGVQITGEETVEDIDEVLRYLQILLADTRLKPARRDILMTQLDALLETRLQITQSV